MDEQTSPVLDPAISPVGEANTAAPASEPIKTEIPTVEPVQEIPPETTIAPLPAPEVTPEIAPPPPITAVEPVVSPAPTPEESAPLEASTEVPPANTAGSVQAEPETAQTAAPAETETAQSRENEPFAAPVALPADAPPPPSTPLQTVTVVREVAVKPNMRELFTRAIDKLSGRTAKRLAKIMTLLETKTQITNDDVEKLLHVSDATATRYLSALKRQGRIIQHGKTGRAVSYRKP